jgi:hypothetical protein
MIEKIARSYNFLQLFRIVKMVLDKLSGGSTVSTDCRLLIPASCWGEHKIVATYRPFALLCVRAHIGSGVLAGEEEQLRPTRNTQRTVRAFN